jgi:hypothetical protein
MLHSNSTRKHKVMDVIELPLFFISIQTFEGFVYLEDLPLSGVSLIPLNTLDVNIGFD